MDKTIRYYWIVCDNDDGTETEYIERTREAALRRYEKIRAPYKKIVACYNDHDEDLMTWKRIF